MILLYAVIVLIAVGLGVVGSLILPSADADDHPRMY